MYYFETYKPNNYLQILDILYEIKEKDFYLRFSIKQWTKSQKWCINKINSLYTFFFIKLIKIFEFKFIIEISGILSISKFLFNLIVIIFENNFDN